MAEKVAAEEAQAVTKPPHATKEVGGLPLEEGLEIFGPEPETFHTSVGDLTIAPMVMRQIREFMVHANKFLPELQKQIALKAEVSMHAIMNIDPEAFMKAVAVAAGTTPKVLDELRPDEFIRIVSKILVVNLDFFVRTLPRAIGGAEISVLSAVARLVQDGAAKSRGLLQKDTDLKT